MTQFSNNINNTPDAAPIGMQGAPMESEEEEGLNLRDYFRVCVSRWKWFVISIVVCLGFAALYVMRTPNTYTRNAAVVIKDEDSGNSPVASALSDMGLFSTSTNVANELLAFKSPALIADVIERLGLQTTYTSRKGLKKQLLYGKTAVVEVEFPDFTPSQSASLRVKLLGKGKAELSRFVKGKEKFSEEMEVSLGDTVKTPIGRLVVTPGPAYSADYDKTIYVTRNKLSTAIAFFQKELTEKLADEDATAIDFTMKDQSIERADNFLNTLITIYNEIWVGDKAKMATATSHFINERLNVIEKELGNVDSDIAQYKGDNLIPDVQAAAQMYMQNANTNEQQQLQVATQLSIVKYLIDYVQTAANTGKLLPTNSGLDNPGIASQVTEYNTAQLNRDRLLLSTGENSPIVAEQDQALASMRNALLAALRNQRKAFETQLNSLIRSDRATSQQIASSPGKAKYLLSVERQQKVKEALYLFLLQKREENELSLAFTPSNTRIITPPMGSDRPTAPATRIIIMAAFVLGLALPAIAIFVSLSLDNTLRSRTDLEHLRTPLIGEIPDASDGKTSVRRISRYMRSFLGAASKIEEAPSLLVREHGRSIVNESFRMVRANFEFMTRNGKNRVIMVTSFTPGSGKTFISLNLAAAMAIKKKDARILAIDLDLRRVSLSRALPMQSLGVADYLSERIEDVKPYIQSTGCDGLYILPGGTIPPNPTELLYSDRLARLIDKLKEEYDYIFLDCPPTEVVADASIITPLADMTLFVLRAGLLDRRLLPEVDRIYDSKRFNNFMIILNGTTSTASPYRRYAYSNYYTKKDDE